MAEGTFSRVVAHICKMGARHRSLMNQMSHKNNFAVIINGFCLEMGVCYVPLHFHSFEIICRGWKLGLADHMMRSFYK